YAIEVFNEAFGGSFSSRLFRNIRTAQGLAYSVGGGIGTAFDHPGILRLSMGTKSQSTVESIQAMYQQIDDLAQQPITQAEIQQAKDSILNSFVFNFDTPEKVLRERMAYEFYGYPPDFLEKYRAGIEKVQIADVARIPPKYLHKDQLAILVVGNTSEFDKPLASLGPVTKVDITIPPPPGAEQGSRGRSSKNHPLSCSQERNRRTFLLTFSYHHRPLQGGGMLRWFSLLLLSVLVVPVSASADEWKKDYRPSGKPVIRVDANDADIRVNDWERKDIEARVITEGYKIGPDAVRVTESQSGNQVTLEVHTPQFGLVLHRHSVQVEVSMPRQGDLNLHSRDGNIRVVNIQGDLRLDSGDGDLEVRSADGSLNAETHDGNIRANGRFDALTLHTDD